MPTQTLRIRLIAAAIAASLLVGACGGDDDDDVAADEDTTTTERETTTTEKEKTTTTTEPRATTTAPASPVPGADADPTAILLGDRAILLDGFFGVGIPEGWAVSTAVVPEPSVSPPEGETAVDIEAIDQVLVIGPEVDPDAATFALLHYSHSDSVPDLARFSDGIREVVGVDGTQFTEGQSAQIGGQEALLHQLQTTDGDNGLFITIKAGDEYFFVLAIVSDDVYAGDIGELVASITMEPAAIR